MPTLGCASSSVTLKFQHKEKRQCSKCVPPTSDLGHGDKFLIDLTFNLDLSSPQRRCQSYQARLLAMVKNRDVCCMPRTMSYWCTGVSPSYHSLRQVNTDLHGQALTSDHQGADSIVPQGFRDRLVRRGVETCRFLSSLTLFTKSFIAPHLHRIELCGSVWLLCGECGATCGVCVATMWRMSGYLRRVCGYYVENEWLLCGECVASVWLLCGECVATVWRVCGYYQESVWLQCGECVATMRRVCGYNEESVWLLCGYNEESVWLQCGECVATMRRVCGYSVASVWLLCGECVATVWRVYRISSREEFSP
ncbi:hypothetical protein RRG08_020854 [Elysia crispata]|uniref:Uncharacterized protein n=1 Tax=Elysia crispata TaxID=231223 RepID=A0AAE0XV07_9GAST|nr:hypothetical protein RRG08_020854 [Elysia crispata]